MGSPTAAVPEYLPARMVNEFVYCPRLCHYEWVEGLFAESADTVEGKIRHARVDSGTGALAKPEETAPNEIKTGRSVTLSSEAHKVIAKMDLIELEGETATPVDYKRGRPKEGDGGLEAWPADRAQIAVQGLILRENGYRCEEGVLWYSETRQKVRVALTEAEIGETKLAIEGAWSMARGGERPAPLSDSPKCTGCSLNGICLPDETKLLAALEGEGEKPEEVRRLAAPRGEMRSLYLNTAGLRVGKSGEVLQIREKEKLLQEARIGELGAVNVFGNIQVSTQAIQSLCEAEVPVCYFSMGGWFYGITHGLIQKNVFLRRSQFRRADDKGFCLELAKRLVAAKIKNQRTLVLRNHAEPSEAALRGMKLMAEEAERAGSAEELLGIEGNGARLYFGEFAGMLKGEAALEFEFEGRNRRPPRDPINAMLSLGYSLLAKDLTVACAAVGLDPYMGFYHQPRFGRPALALDLMEPFRPLVVDSTVLTAVNTGMVGAGDFVRAGKSVALTADGRKGFFRAYEGRMDGLVTHPLLGYRVSYRRLLEVQTRILARVVEGELKEYHAFVTR
jgi:CRISPR-associated protein Cas1